MPDLIKDENKMRRLYSISALLKYFLYNICTILTRSNLVKGCFVSSLCVFVVAEFNDTRQNSLGVTTGRDFGLSVEWRRAGTELTLGASVFSLVEGEYRACLLRLSLWWIRLSERDQNASTAQWETLIFRDYQHYRNRGAVLKEAAHD